MSEPDVVQRSQRLPLAGRTVAPEILRQFAKVVLASALLMLAPYRCDAYDVERRCCCRAIPLKDTRRQQRINPVAALALTVKGNAPLASLPQPRTAGRSLRAPWNTFSSAMGVLRGHTRPRVLFGDQPTRRTSRAASDEGVFFDEHIVPNRSRALRNL
jgi:hypothetical protein